MERSQRERTFGIAGLVFYVVGWVLLERSLLLPVLAFVAFAFCVVVSIKAGVGAGDRGKLRRHVVFTLCLFLMAPILVMALTFQKRAEAKSFESYLAQHKCRFERYVATGYSEGGCTRYDQCEDAAELEDAQYFCALTQKRITFSDFKSGDFGH